MTTTKRRRATALVEWEYQGTRGILVHVDPKQFWLLPGGGLNRDYKTKRQETPLAAVVRELSEETGLEASSAMFLFAHAGRQNDHQVFLVRAHGNLKIVDSHEAPAFGLCQDDMSVTTILTASDVSTAQVQMLKSTQQIIQRYHALRRDQPKLAHALATLDQYRGSNPTPAPASARPEPMPVQTEPQPLSIPGQGEGLVISVGNARLELVQGSIVRQDVDAVVNAANAQLANGSGVSGALHDAAGAQQLEQACRAIGGCPTGEARITPGFGLKARHIIHAVGPIYDRYSPERAAQLLASAYHSSLAIASQEGLQSIAFPSLSTGIYGFPLAQAAPIALQTVIDYLREHSGLEVVRFVLVHDTYPVFERELRRLVSVPIV